MGPPRIADQLLQLKTVARKEHSRLLCSLAVSSQLRIGHARQQVIIFLWCNWAVCKRFSMRWSGAINQGNVTVAESGNAAAKSQWHCIRPRVSSISTGVVCRHIDPETKDLGLLTRSSGLVKHGHAPLGFEYSVGLQVVRYGKIAHMCGWQKPTGIRSFKTGRQWRNSVQYHQLHVMSCVCAPSWDISMQMSTLSTQSWWILGVILDQSCNPVFKRWIKAQSISRLCATDTNASKVGTSEANAYLDVPGS